MANLVWEQLRSSDQYMVTWRAKVIGGWLVFTDRGHTSGLAFLPDPKHHWDGGSPEPGDTDL